MQEQWNPLCRIDCMLFAQENTVHIPAAGFDEAKSMLAEREEQVRRLQQVLCELLRTNQQLRLALMVRDPGSQGRLEESWSLSLDSFRDGRTTRTEGFEPMLQAF